MADTEIGTAPGITTLPHLRSLSIVGPHRVTGVQRYAEPPPRLLVPGAVAGRRNTVRVGHRPPPGDAGVPPPGGEKDHARLMTFYARGRKEKNFEAGITKALEAILASPQFLFRIEEHAAPKLQRSGAAYRLGDYELASRLSFFLWGAGPMPSC